ncbi:radical SAM/SPASM domain-containing protein [Pseudodesulfovibrio tunisiensis]|uniref:radical SAM/SPASM domain-containing protein n=1 Tax=Pseudodesulfovibrio tunisiensis TaxID=463192 RepID=UPI002436E0D4|nr:radical SAM protein [Pseudodesulfovibrio tunisiensis]
MRKETVKKPPWPYNIELTNKCPFSCIMCPREKSMTRPAEDMKWDVYTKLIDEFHSLHDGAKLMGKKLLRLHGMGESLVHPLFDEMIRYAADRGFKVAISCNPLLLTDTVADRLLDSGLHTLFFSLDGHDDASFARIRGVNNAYDRSVRRLERFLEKRASSGAIERLELSMIDFERNRDSIRSIERYWSNHPLIDRFRKKIFVNWAGLDDGVNALIDEEASTSATRLANNKGGCVEPWAQLSILVDGEAVPCCFDYDGKYPLGNILEEGVMGVWNGKAMQALRQEFLQREITNPLCRKCLFRPEAS